MKIDISKELLNFKNKSESDIINLYKINSSKKIYYMLIYISI